jgi:CRISPR-associated endonuclease Cas2
MGVLIAYDIADPRRWRRVYKRVQAEAARLQYSLFYGELTSREVDLPAADLARSIDPSADDVRLYQLPDDAWSACGGNRSCRTVFTSGPYRICARATTSREA